MDTLRIITYCYHEGRRNPYTIAFPRHRYYKINKFEHKIYNCLIEAMTENNPSENGDNDIEKLYSDAIIDMMAITGYNQCSGNTNENESGDYDYELLDSVIDAIYSSFPGDLTKYGPANEFIVKYG
jgi:hypothetical protein